MSIVRYCRHALAAGAALVALAACGSDSTSPPTGNLTVIISAFAGTTGAVTVTGPGTYSKVLTATTTLTGLPVGSYTVSGAPVVATGAVVGSDTTRALVSGSPATVAKNQTAAVAVTYGETPATGGLWVANAYDPTSSVLLVEFGPAQLTSSGAPNPIATILGPNPSGFPVTVAFDRQGNLWLANANTNVIDEYTVAQLDSSNPTPVLALAVSGASVMSALAFDSVGNLWMPDANKCDFYEFKAATLASHSGAVTLAPDVTIAPGCNAPVHAPWGIAFDAHWNLWVGDRNGEDIYEYPADSLVAGFSGLHTARTISVPDQVAYVAFDSSGNLWASAGAYGLGLNEYSAAQLADTTTALAPHVAITLPGMAFAGVAFDNSGNLWMADFYGNTVVELSTAQLAAGGTVATPAVTLGATNNSLGVPWGIAFDPHASGLPLFARVPKVAHGVASRVWGGAADSAM